MTSTTTDVVIAYAKRFGRLLPLCWPVDGECGCGRGHEARDVGKAPLTQRGWHDASARLGQLKFWLQRYPLANWGLALADGYVVVDPDSAEALTEAQERGLPPTVVRKSRNPAYLYLRPEGCEITNATKRGRSHKLDILATGYLVVLGEHVNGAHIEMVGDELAVAPEWCCELLSRQKAPPGLKPRESPTGEPPVVLNESGIQLWHGAVVIGPTGETLRRADNQVFDRSETLFAIGRSLAYAGATPPTIVTALKDRDVRLQFDKYSGRGDDREYWRIANKVVEHNKVRNHSVTPEDGLPTITLSGRYMRELTDASLAAMNQANANDPYLFVRGNTVIRLIRKESVVTADPLNKDSLRGVLDRAADFVIAKIDRDKEITQVPSRPPKDVVADILSLPEYNLPQLRAIAGAPILLPNGEFLMREGYHAASGRYLYLNGLSDDIRSDMPLARALDTLFNHLLCDFPFRDEASKAHALAYLLLPFVRAYIQGPTPLYLVDAPTRGTGKGLLVDVFAEVALGHPAWVMSPPDNDDEVKKTITALLAEGSPLILLDNVHNLSSPALCAVLTTTKWRGRMLGQSKILQVPNESVWVATGNNVTLSDEMVRRVVVSRLDAGVQRPENRTGFKHKLPSWARENRAELVSACLSVLGEWVREGAPRGDVSMGRFEEWASVLGGILSVAGVPGFLTNRDWVYAQADSETDEWVAFCGMWWESHRELAVTGGDLFQLAKPNRLLMDVWGGRNELSATQRIGHALEARRDRVYGRFVIRSAKRDSHTGSKAYRLEEKTVSDAE